MVGLAGTFSRFCPFRVLVIGDFMLDTYTFGTVQRISPEAPVSVVQVESEEKRPGGAGNVVLNLTSLGGFVSCFGRIGDDVAGMDMKNSLSYAGVDTAGIFVDSNFQTPVKNRIIADNQQIVRVDFEHVEPLAQELEGRVLDLFTKLIDGVQVVAISDYGKGFLTDTLLAGIIQRAKDASVLIVVDPKGCDFSKYRGVDVIKPNLKEAYLASGLPAEAPLEDVADRILQETGAAIVMITRSNDGISLFDRNRNHKVFPVKVRDVKDVTGAGDTVLAMVTCALVNGMSVDEAIQLSNLAAGIAVERLGCARVTIPELAMRLLDNDVVSKIFEEDHIFALQEILKNKQSVLVGVNSGEGLTAGTFRCLSSIARNCDRELIVYIRDSCIDDDFVRILASLSEVGFIVVKSESIEHICKVINPDEVFVIEDDTLVPVNHAMAILA